MGLLEALSACRHAANLAGCQATTNGSFIPAVTNVAGYLSPFFKCRYGSISIKAIHSVESFGFPNSTSLAGPFENSSILIGFITPTKGTATANKSGRSVMARPIRIPPALPPTIPNFAGEVYLLLIKYSAQLIRSFQVLGFVVLNPPLCQLSPNSPPPRT